MEQAQAGVPGEFSAGHVVEVDQSAVVGGLFGLRALRVGG
jgi:hypothetical protein